MQYQRMPIEIESPEEMGYDNIQFNLAESSVRDIYVKDLDINLQDIFLCYGEHRGNIALREAIIKNEIGLNADNVLVCPSAATSLFIISTTLLNQNDHLIVLRPNYATNIETPRAINCQISYVDLYFENGFQFNLEAITNAVQANTKLISITTPHNPTGVVFDATLIDALIVIAEEKNIALLIDETYRYLNFQTTLLPYYAAKSKQVISVCSLSKAHGVPGIRTGWIINKDAQLMHRFLAAKEQIIITNSVIDEAIALHILSKENYLTNTHLHISNNFKILKNWIENEQSYLEWIEPTCGVVCFPRIKAQYKVDLQKFYSVLFEQYKTLVGAGHWFEQDDRSMRVGFGYPSNDELAQGLNNITNAIETTLI